MDAPSRHSNRKAGSRLGWTAILILVYIVGIHSDIKPRYHGFGASLGTKAGFDGSENIPKNLFNENDIREATAEEFARVMKQVSKARKRMFDEQRAKGGALWYYKHGQADSAYGPWGQEQMQTWIEMGHLSDGTLVRRSNETSFVRLRTSSLCGNKLKRVKIDERSDVEQKANEVEETRMAMLEAADNLNFIEAQRLKMKLEEQQKQLQKNEDKREVEEEFGVNDFKFQLRNIYGDPSDVWLPCTIESKKPNRIVDISFLSGQIMRNISMAYIFPVSNIDVVRWIRTEPPITSTPQVLEAIAPVSKYPTILEPNSQEAIDRPIEEFELNSDEDKEFVKGAKVEVRTMDNPFCKGEEMWYEGIIREVRTDGCIITRNLDPEIYPNNRPKFYTYNDIRWPRSNELISIDTSCPKGHDCIYMREGDIPDIYDELPECDSCNRPMRVTSDYFHCPKCSWDCCEQCYEKRLEEEMPALDGMDESGLSKPEEMFEEELVKDI